MKKKLPDRLGVVLMQHGLSLRVHLAAARAAFYDLQLPELRILVNENRIASDCHTLPLTVHGCVGF